MTIPKMNSYPWDNLVTSRKEKEYVARLASSDINPRGRKVFWAKGSNGNPALLIEYKTSSWKQAALPSFKNIHVIDYKNESSLAIELVDLQLSDIFLKVCLDIIATLQEVNESAARQASILRLERWSSFLRPSRSKLTSESQKGLIAELHFLQRDVFSVYEMKDALIGWIGPEAGVRDFAYGQVFVEVKSIRGSASTNITISSENQLNVNPSESLYLYVSELNDAPCENEGAFSIADVVEETRALIESPLQKSIFDNKLASIGYFDEDDYSDQKWSEGESYYYAVIDGFPKIDTRSCDPGVSKVNYQIDLTYCENFLVERETVIESMR